MARTLVPADAFRFSSVSSPLIEMPYSGHRLPAARDGTLVYIRTAVNVPGEVGLVAPNGDTPRC